METSLQKNNLTLPKLSLRSPLATIIVIWLLWAVIIIGFQTVIQQRLSLARPDNVLFWTGDETRASSQRGKVYLTEPFMNQQVSWDSEYYLSIAVNGYDDPLASRVDLPDYSTISKNYAFFPLYPVLIHFVAIPLQLLNMTPIATATLAGVIISLLGTLGGMVALYDLTHDILEDSGGVRTAFYLLIFPTSFFLAQVYTEGMFIALAFGSLALMRHKQFMWAAILAALAVWTRPTGVLLVVPLGLATLQGNNWRETIRGKINWKLMINLLWILIPVLAYLAWDHFFGTQFRAVEMNFFSRSILDISKSFEVWGAALKTIGSANTQRSVYYVLEFGSMLLVLVASLATLRRFPLLAVFSLLILLFSAMSGVPQSMVRYMLGVPSLFVFLGQLGRNEAFDRTWTVASVLLLGMLTMLFTFDMWVA